MIFNFLKFDILWFYIPRDEKNRYRISPNFVKSDKKVFIQSYRSFYNFRFNPSSSSWAFWKNQSFFYKVEIKKKNCYHFTDYEIDNSATSSCPTGSWISIPIYSATNNLISLGLNNLWPAVISWASVFLFFFYKKYFVTSTENSTIYIGWKLYFNDILFQEKNWFTRIIILARRATYHPVFAYFHGWVSVYLNSGKIFHRKTDYKLFIHNESLLVEVDFLITN